MLERSRRPNQRLRWGMSSAKGPSHWFLKATWRQTCLGSRAAFGPTTLQAFLGEAFRSLAGFAPKAFQGEVAGLPETSLQGLPRALPEKAFPEKALRGTSETFKGPSGPFRTVPGLSRSLEVQQGRVGRASRGSKGPSRGGPGQGWGGPRQSTGSGLGLNIHTVTELGDCSLATPQGEGCGWQALQLSRAEPVMVSLSARRRPLTSRMKGVVGGFGVSGFGFRV